MIWTREFWCETVRDPNSFWAMLTSIATFALVSLAWWQLRKLVQIGRSDFVYRLKENFFTEEARKLVFLADNDLLIFRSEPMPYFEITYPNSSAGARMNDLGITGTTTSTEMVDDFLLGPLEDVGLLLSRKRVTLEDAYEFFDSYVQICAENEAISNYLRWAREGEGNEDVYDHFQNLYERLEREGPKIRQKKRKERIPR